MTWWFTGLDVLKGERSAKYHPALWNVLFTKSRHWLYPFNCGMRINLNFDQDAKFSVQADPLTAKPSGHTFFTSRVFFAFFLFCSTYWVKPSIIFYFNFPPLSSALSETSPPMHIQCVYLHFRRAASQQIRNQPQNRAIYTFAQLRI